VKHLLIIGANSDIAKATAHCYAKEGYSLTLAARQIEQLEGFAQDLRIRCNSQISLRELDLMDATQCSNFLSHIEEMPDTVLFAAGYLGEQDRAQVEDQETEKIFRINALSAMDLLGHFANQFEKRKSGSIIAISSVAGDRGRMSNYFYGAAKAALSTYLSGLRNRLHSSNVNVLDVRPGFVATKMTSHLDLPAKLTATPEKVAKKIYKAHSKGANVTYVISAWRLIMLIIKLIPEPIFKRLSL